MRVPVKRVTRVPSNQNTQPMQVKPSTQPIQAMQKRQPTQSMQVKPANTSIKAIQPIQAMQLMQPIQFTQDQPSQQSYDQVVQATPIDQNTQFIFGNSAEAQFAQMVMVKD